VKKVLLGCVLTLLAVCLFAGAGWSKELGEYKLVLILPGAINDQSWNATNYAGLLACNEELGTKMEYVENVQAPDYESTFRNYAEREYDLILAAGTQFDEIAVRVGANYPKTTFCVVNGMEAAGTNVCPVLPKEYEASFLAGIIGGHVSKSGKAGIVGGFPNKLMIRLLNTYEWGLRTAKPDINVARSYSNSWSDVALGKQIAESMVDGGADVLFFYANEVGLGAIQAAKEKGAKYIGFASDQNSVAPGTVAASVYFDFRNLYKWIVEKYSQGELKPQVNEAGIAEGIVSVSYTDEIPASVRDLVTQAQDAIKKGDALFFFSQFPEPLN
jgi:basic membrane protein A